MNGRKVDYSTLIEWNGRSWGKRQRRATCGVSPLSRLPSPLSTLHTSCVDLKHLGSRLRVTHHNDIARQVMASPWLRGYLRMLSAFQISSNPLLTNLQVCSTNREPWNLGTPWCQMFIHSYLNGMTMERTSRRRRKQSTGGMTSWRTHISSRPRRADSGHGDPFAEPIDRSFWPGSNPYKPILVRCLGIAVTAGDMAQVMYNLKPWKADWSFSASSLNCAVDGGYITIASLLIDEGVIPQWDYLRYAMEKEAHPFLGLSLDRCSDINKP